MKSKVVESEESVFIEKIPRLKWSENRDNSFIGSVHLSLNALGENYSYNFLMGISGAAFRLHFKPDWCPVLLTLQPDSMFQRYYLNHLGIKANYTGLMITALTTLNLYIRK